MKIHPLTIIIIGLLLVSVLMNYSQHRSYMKLKEEINKSRSSIIILPDKNQMPNYLKPAPKRNTEV